MSEIEVTALRELRSGRVYPLQDEEAEDTPYYSLRLGRARDCDITIRDRRVAKVHCFLLQTPRGVEVMACGSARSWINKVALGSGTTLLKPSNVLRVGNTRLVACGDSLGEAPEMVVRNLHELIQSAESYHETRNHAAEMLGIPSSTFYRWLEKNSFKIAASLALLLLVLGSTMLLGGREPTMARGERSAPMLPAAATATRATTTKATAATTAGTTDSTGSSPREQPIDELVRETSTPSLDSTSAKRPVRKKRRRMATEKPSPERDSERGEPLGQGHAEEFPWVFPGGSYEHEATEPSRGDER